MDLATIGTVLSAAGLLAGSVVAFLGKRGENATTRMNMEIDQIQEERNGLREQVAARDTRIAELLAQHGTDQVEIARLRIRIINLGGDP
ncbi:hypothetical protein ACIBAC_28920 [Streptomyces sp. NPDC051362]|uniref:hypothetical protein n=1 Tax=Streptomyces sp. NPDC051362 TaxID=3365651 RepID=UPI00378CE82E